MTDGAIATKLLSRVADRATKNYFDEMAIEYEAARLSRFPVVLVFYFDGADIARADFSRATNSVLVAKGEAECFAYLKGETPNLDFEAVFAPDAASARALQAALNRTAGPRLVARDGQLI